MPCKYHHKTLSLIPAFWTTRWETKAELPRMLFKNCDISASSWIYCADRVTPCNLVTQEMQSLAVGRECLPLPNEQQILHQARSWRILYRMPLLLSEDICGLYKPVAIVAVYPIPIVAEMRWRRLVAHIRQSLLSLKESIAWNTCGHSGMTKRLSRVFAARMDLLLSARIENSARLSVNVPPTHP
jgi:hypothetical protein